MTAFAIGLGIVWLVITIRGAKYTIEGVGGILTTIVICYGLGSLVLALLKH